MSLLSRERRAQLMEHLQSEDGDGGGEAAPAQAEAEPAPETQAAPESAEPASPPSGGDDGGSGAASTSGESGDPLGRIERAYADERSQWERERDAFAKEKAELEARLALLAQARPEPEVKSEEADLLDRFIKGEDLDTDEAVRAMAERLVQIERAKKSEKAQMSLLQDVTEVLKDFDDVDQDDLLDAIALRPHKSTREHARALSIKHSKRALAQRRALAEELGIKLDEHGKRIDDAPPAAAPRARGSSSTTRASTEPGKKFGSVREATKALQQALRAGEITL